MLVVETIAKIRRAHFIEGKSIKQICRELRVSRNTVRKVIRSGATEFTYDRTTQPRPKIGPWRSELDAMLAENARRPKRDRLTVIRIYEELRNRGYGGGYDAVRRYAASWSKATQEASASAYVPLSFDPGEAYQFDWSHEIVILDGVTMTVKVAHVRLCHSRMPFVRAYARANTHPEMRDKTIWEVFEEERPSLVPYVGPFDGFHAVPASVSKTCLIRFDKNRYSVDARAVGRPVEIRAYADRLECWQDGRIVGSHVRVFGRGKTIYDPLHYIPVLARKPGALRNGAPFKDWDLPSALRRVQRKLERQPGGDRQVVEILGAVLTDGLEAVEAACAEALSHNVHSAGVVLNILARRREPPPPLTITTPDALRLACEPAANCDRYDSLRRANNGTITGAGRHGATEALWHEDSL